MYNQKLEVKWVNGRKEFEETLHLMAVYSAGEPFIKMFYGKLQDLLFVPFWGEKMCRLNNKHLMLKEWLIPITTLTPVNIY